MASISPRENTAQDDKEAGDITRPWNLEDKYRFAPEPVEGDPWKYFLDPILEKEKIRCDGWKDEVGNLLIFAGLFSAVVTAFIIESYKTLKSDPNDDIIGLLSQISNQLNRSGSGIITSSSLPQLPSQSFAPTPSAVRVNMFWFLSLIFSLATVLIGIVSLQWLREYQSYPGTSPQEDLAIHHMRSEGMRKWHVWKILAALPVLLQVALTLFCAGIIDFLHALRKTSVTATIAGAVGLVLLFIVATTTLPAAQVIAHQVLYLSPFHIQNPPSQCPYKSPQSRMLFASVDLLSRIRTSSLVNIKILWAIALTMIKGRRPNRSRGYQTGATSMNRLLSRLWRQSNWGHFDKAWLNVRDAISRRQYDRSMNLESPLRNWSSKYPFNTEYQPLFDTTSFIRQTIDGEHASNSLRYLYSCFSALSLSFNISAMNKESPHVYLGQNDVRPYVQDNLYLSSRCDLYTYNDLSIFGHLDRHFTGEEVSEIIALQQDLNILKFLSANPTFREKFKIHREEIMTIIRARLFGRRSKRIYLGPLNNYFGLGVIVPLARRERALVEYPYILFVFQYMRNVEQLYTYIAHPDAVILDKGDLHAEPGVGLFLQDCAHKIIASRDAAWLQQDIEVMTKITNSVDHLLDVITDSLATMDPRKNHPNQNLAFYCAAIFLRGLLKYREDTVNYDPIKQHLQVNRLLRLLKEQKSSIFNRNGPDLDLESQFNRNLMFTAPTNSVELFSMRWWLFIDEDQENKGHLIQQPEHAEDTRLPGQTRIENSGFINPSPMIEMPTPTTLQAPDLAPFPGIHALQFPVASISQTDYNSTESISPEKRPADSHFFGETSNRLNTLPESSPTISFDRQDIVQSTTEPEFDIVDESEG